MIKKLLVIMSIVVVIALFYGVDSAIANTYEITIVDINPQPAYADGKTPIEITVQLFCKEEPVAGHVLYMLPKRGGLKASRIETDENGIARFTYFPYLATQYIKAEPVSIQVMDEDNSKFVRVPATHTFTVDLKMPEATDTGNSGLTIDDIFGE